MAQEKPTPAELIRTIRLQIGSHDKLAQALGTSRQTVIRWQHGAQPRADYRAKLAELAGCEADDFLYDEITGPLTADDLAAVIREVAAQLASQTELLRDIAAAAAALGKLEVLVDRLEALVRPAANGHT